MIVSRFLILTVSTIALILPSPAGSAQRPLTSADRDALLAIFCRPNVESMEIELLEHTMDFTKVLSEDEIQSEIDAMYERAVARAENDKIPYRPDELHAVVEAGVRKNIRGRVRKTLHKHVCYTGHLYKSMVNRENPDPMSTEGAFEEVYVNYGDREQKDYLHYNVNNIKKTAYLRNTKSMWKRYDYSTLGIPSNPTLLGIFESPADVQSLISAGRSERVITGMRELMSKLNVVIDPDVTWEGHTVDEIRVLEPASGATLLLVRYDSENSIRLYSESAMLPTGELIYEQRYDNYRYVDGLRWEFPFTARNERNDEKGSTREIVELEILSVKINETIDTKTFELEHNIDSSYTVVDTTVDPPVVHSPFARGELDSLIGSDVPIQIAPDVLASTKGPTPARQSDTPGDDNTAPNTSPRDDSSVTPSGGKCPWSLVVALCLPILALIVWLKARSNRRNI